MPERSDREEDRRRSPRFACGGYARINRLPSNGIFLPGKVRDLGLHGCCVDTTLPMDCGTRAEILVRVNAASFRAVGEVRAIRAGSGACMEFVYLSARGEDMLADLIKELARLQAAMNQLKSARRDMDAETFGKQLEEGKLQAAMLSERLPFLETVLRTESSEAEQAVSNGENLTVQAQPLVIPIDLFG